MSKLDVNNNNETNKVQVPRPKVIVRLLKWLITTVVVVVFFVGSFLYFNLSSTSKIPVSEAMMP